MDAIILKSFIPEIFLSLSILLQLVFNVRLINNLRFNFPILDKEIFIQTLFVLTSLFFLLLNLKIEGFFSNFLFFNDYGTKTIKIIFILISFFALIFVFKAFYIKTLNLFETASHYRSNRLGVNIYIFTYLGVNLNPCLRTYIKIPNHGIKYFKLNL
jgi:hypothetical protein